MGGSASTAAGRSRQPPAETRGLDLPGVPGQRGGGGQPGRAPQKNAGEGTLHAEVTLSGQQQQQQQQQKCQHKLCQGCCGSGAHGFCPGCGKALDRIGQAGDGKDSQGKGHPAVPGQKPQAPNLPPIRPKRRPNKAKPPPQKQSVPPLKPPQQPQPLPPKRQLTHKPPKLEPLDWWPSTKAAAKSNPGAQPKTPRVSPKPPVELIKQTFVTPSGIVVVVEMQGPEASTSKDGPSIRREQREYIRQERKAMEDAARSLGVKMKDIPGLLQMCQQHGLKFCDLEFPAAQESLNFGGCENLLWMRPDHFLEQPGDKGLHVKSIEPNDIDQGCIGDCWYMASLAALAEMEQWVWRSFMDAKEGQGCRRQKELQNVGAWRVSLCKGGWWQEVVVDDYLACEEPGWSTGSLKPYFAMNREEPGEMWVAVMEKAFAKVHGSYSAIRGGAMTQALRDLTGRPSSKFKPYLATTTRGAETKLWNDIQGWDKEGCMMAVSGGHKGGGRMNAARAANSAKAWDRVGLVPRHAYTLLRAVTADGQRLMQLRNPWGDGKEWKGDWSDGHHLWEKHPSLRKACRPEKAADGQFWMCFTDFLKWFDDGAVCLTQETWREVRFHCNVGAADLPSMFLELRVTRGCRMVLGQHQRDTRGLPSSHPDSDYHSVRISVVGPKADGTGYELVARESYIGSREVDLDNYFQPAAKPYYLFFSRCGREKGENGKKSYSVSIHHEAHDFGSIRVLAPTPALMSSIQYARPCPYGEFTPEACRQVEVECQWGLTREELLTKRRSSSYTNAC